MTRLGGCVRLVIAGEMPVLEPALEARVEAHWHAALGHAALGQAALGQAALGQAALGRQALFNGIVFCADDIGPEVITGHWTEYRRVVAQMAEAALVPVLRVQSLAVGGVLMCPDGVLVGRREVGAAYQAGLWQLPPAGSVDQGAAVPGGASWRQALLAELQEELGIGAEEVGRMRPLGLVRHPSGVLDLGVRIETKLGAEAILARHAATGNREYERLMVVPVGEVAERVAAEGGRLVPSAGPFLEMARGGGAG